jgi:two-component system LytT family response regulator
LDIKQIQDIVTCELPYATGKMVFFRNAAAWGLSVLSILLIFRPFGISDDNISRLLTTVGGFGIITFLVIYVNNVTLKDRLYYLFNKKWYLHYELLYTLIFLPQICLGNFIFSSLVIHEFQFSIAGFLEISFYTVVLLLPIVLVKSIVTVAIQYNKEIVMLNTKIDYYTELTSTNKIVPEKNDSIELLFENEALTLPRAGIILFSAWGNYIRILVHRNNNAFEIVKRGRIKNVEDQLQPYLEFYQCHRSYIVNIEQIHSINGNAKKSEIMLRYTEKKIPVARTCYKTIKDHLDKISFC